MNTETCNKEILREEAAVMGKNHKSTRRILLMALLAAMCISGAFGSMTVYAKSMKSTKGISWGLKTNTTMVYKSYWGGVGMITQNVTMTNFNDAWSSSKAGYRKLTFTLNFIRKKKPTAKQLVKAATYYTIKHPEINDTSPRCYFAVVDYKTGKSLMASNPYGVKVTHGDWTYSSTTTYSVSGYSLGMRNVSVDVCIEYPYTYKRLCIGVGGWKRMNQKSSDQRFWNGTLPFWKTKLYRSTKNKKISRFATWRFDP